MYLAGFSLTLVFVIARIVELMQATVNAEEEGDNYKKKLAERVAREALDRDGEDSTLMDDSGSPPGPPGPPGSTPFTLRRRHVSANGDKDD